MYFKRALQQAVDLPPRHANASLAQAYHQYLKPAMSTNYAPIFPPAVPQPIPGAPLLYTRRDFTLHRGDFTELFAIEAGKMKRAFCTMIATQITEHLEQTLLHYLAEHNANVEAPLEERKELGVFLIIINRQASDSNRSTPFFLQYDAQSFSCNPCTSYQAPSIRTHITPWAPVISFFSATCLLLPPRH
ncbi:hypothetical protein DFS34DRAFT_94920 [Phlyctochytrium arcticum]|nr:hypothetical protein DFS34DRAFT_94920 [Phlyctochytrium arcticum]